MERKDAGAIERLELKGALTVDEAGFITGLASVFGSADLGGDIVHKGAFAGASAPLPMLASHDPADVVGVWDELAETAEGLAVKGRLLVAEVKRAAEVRALILAGAMRGLSIGYIATKKAPRQGGGRDLFRVELKEVSVVAVPMHPAAKITSAKALEGGKDGEGMEAAEVEAKIASAVTAAVAPLLQKVRDLEAKAARPDVDLTGKEVTPERKAFRSYLVAGNHAPETELKALTLNSDPAGGYLAPPELSSEILKDIVEMSPFRAMASVKGTNAPSVIYPTRKPMGNATWDGETEEETETSGNPFGSTEVAVKGMSTYLDLSNMLMQDAPAVEGEVREAAAEDFALKEARGFVLGDGAKEPEGLWTNGDIAEIMSGHATTISADRLITFLYSITPFYRNKGVWMGNGTTLGILRTLKDGQGNYLWQPSYQAGQPETLLGRPFVEVIDAPDIAVGEVPLIYGDMAGYRILDRLSLSVLVDPYTRATQKQTRFHMARRVGGRVIQPARFKKFKMGV